MTTEEDESSLSTSSQNGSSNACGSFFVNFNLVASKKSYLTKRFQRQRRSKGCHRVTECSPLSSCFLNVSCHNFRFKVFLFYTQARSFSRKFVSCTSPLCLQNLLCNLTMAKLFQVFLNECQRNARGFLFLSIFRSLSFTSRNTEAPKLNPKSTCRGEFSTSFRRWQLEIEKLSSGSLRKKYSPKILLPQVAYQTTFPA